MPAKVVILPPNLATDRKFEGQSIYARDYCYRHRHGRRATTPTRSYTSLMKKHQKLVGDMNEMQLSDHFTTNPASLSMGYTKKDFNETVGNSRSLGRVKQEYTLPATNGVHLDDTQGAFLDNAPGTLQKIEEAWLDELDTNKRERGNIYGLAGKKMSLHPRKAGDKGGHPKTKSLPGLDKWLSTANEYEKQVVHNFVSNINDAYRPHSTPAGLYLNGNQLVKPIKEGKTVRINSKLISPRLQDLPTSGLSPCPPKTSPLPPKTPPQTPPRTPPRCNESSQSCRSNEEVGHDVATQLPYPSNGKPSSPLYEPERPASVASSMACERPASVPVGKDHTCGNCEACKKKLLKKMIDEMAGAQLSSYENLLKQKARNEKTISNRMYPPQPELYDGYDDYLHPGCTFQYVTPRKKNYFTIHPDFVSENIVDLKKLRKKHEKYFGESKVPVY